MTTSSHTAKFVHCERIPLCVLHLVTTLTLQLPTCYVLQARNLVGVPMVFSSDKSSRKFGMVMLTILKRFEFEPQLMRSGVIVNDAAGPPDEHLFFIKGAPGPVAQLVHSECISSNYGQV